MTVTYPIDFPSNIGVSSFRLGLRTATARTESPFSFSEQIVRFSGELWEIEVGLPRMFRDDAEYFNAFLMKLRGKYGTFLIGDPNAYSPQGTWNGTPVVDGAGQTGDTLNLRGFGINKTNVARAGDYIQLGTGANTRLHKVLGDVNSDASGNASIIIAPNLRSSPSDGQSVISTGAKGRFRLAENLQGFSIDTESTYQVSFRAVEAL